MTNPAVPGFSESLDRPFYGASVTQAFLRFWKKYATFSGRASRSEYWWVVLISSVVSIVFYLVELVAAGGDVAAADTAMTDPGDILNYLWSLATVVPSLAVSVRRLHDVDRSGWWMLIGLLPLVGWILLIVWSASAPNEAGRRFDR
jgi:uncharacterized membrane protein YhaH (DUF805 family)